MLRHDAFNNAHTLLQKLDNKPETDKEQQHHALHDLIASFLQTAKGVNVRFRSTRAEPDEDQAFLVRGRVRVAIVTSPLDVRVAGKNLGLNFKPVGGWVAADGSSAPDAITQAVLNAF